MRVVRVALLLAVFSASAGVASAQDNAPAFGFLAGFNQSWFASSPENEGSAEQGFVGGAFFVLLRDRLWKIQPEVQVSQKGATIAIGRSEATYSITYLNLGLMFRSKLYKGLYTTVGPQFAIPIQSDIDLGAGTLDVKDNTASDFGIVTGVGYQFNTRFGAEFRYDAGFKQVEELPLANFVKRNRAMTFMGMVGF